MIFKHCFQFLNVFSLCCQNFAMFKRRQGKQISRAIIILNPIKVMNMPAFRQWFFVYCLPNKDMFHNISSFICPWIFRFPNHNIASFQLVSSTFPVATTRFIKKAVLSTMCCLIAYKCTANFAGVILVISTSLSSKKNTLRMPLVISSVYFFITQHLFKYNTYPINTQTSPYKITKVGIRDKE